MKRRLIVAMREGLATVEVIQDGHVVGQRIALLGVGPRLGADVHQRESEIGETPDQIVDPARYASSHVGVGAFEHETDVGARAAPLGVTRLHVGPSRFRSGR